MNKIISTLKNIFSITELRSRILYTVLLLAAFRLGAHIVLPGVDAEILQSMKGNSGEGIFGLLDTFLGGAFSQASVLGLGIMPYISASIVLQLATVALPYFQRIQKEGDSGRKKINQWTRILTVFITAAQAIGYLKSTIPAEAIVPGFNQTVFYASSISLLVAGTMFCMYLGEKITDKGIGNGISMLIMIGIVSRFPFALKNEAALRGIQKAPIFLLELAALFFVVLVAMMLLQAVRRIPVQFARQIVGAKIYGGQRQYLPFKLNTAGVMPIIFAQSIMYLPSLVARAFRDQSEAASTIDQVFSDYTTWQYNLLFATLIILFSFFYTAITVNTQQISADMQRNNSFIPGVKPGEETSEYIGSVVDKITLPGSLFLAGIAILPSITVLFGVNRDFSQFFGGTSLLIMVSVVLETLQQIESYLLNKHYEGMMQSGKFSVADQNVAVVS